MSHLWQREDPALAGEAARVVDVLAVHQRQSGRYQQVKRSRKSVKRVEE